MASIRIPRVGGSGGRAVRSDGTPYPLEVTQGHWRLFAESPDEILGLLIDGYLAASDERSRLQTRVELALKAQHMVQNLLNASELFDYCSRDEKQALLHGNQPVVEHWQCAIPLVLVTCFYRPIGERPQPRTVVPGQVWWLDPSTARSLLKTLHGSRCLDVNLNSRPDNWETAGSAYPDPVAQTGEYRWRVLRDWSENSSGTSIRLARTNAEAHLYMDFRPCTDCGETRCRYDSSVVTIENELASRYIGTCPQCGAIRIHEFRLPSSILPQPAVGVRYGGDDPSELLDPGEWLLHADQMSRCVPDGQGDFSPQEIEAARYAAAAAQAAMDEVLKFLPPGASEVPATAFTSQIGKAVYLREPGRFTRARLEAVRDSYAALLTRWV